MKRLSAVILMCAAAVLGCQRGGGDTPQLSAKQIFTSPKQLRLAEAVERGDSKAIGEALRLGADIDEPGRQGIRMLMWAMLAGSVDGFRALLERDANLMARHFNPDVMRPGQKTSTVAEVVSVFPDKRFLEAMLAKGFDANRIVDHDARETMLYNAIYNHDLEAVSRLVNAGADVNFKNAYDRTALDLSVSMRDYRIAMYLLSCGGDPLVKDRVGYSVIDSLKLYGSRGVTPDQQRDFYDFIAALESRGLITWGDIAEADKPKTPNAGITVIEHAPNSEAGRAIRDLDQAERDANARDRAERGR